MYCNYELVNIGADIPCSTFFTPVFVVVAGFFPYVSLMIGYARKHQTHGSKYSRSHVLFCLSVLRLFGLFYVGLRAMFNHHHHHYHHLSFHSPGNDHLIQLITRIRFGAIECFTPSFVLRLRLRLGNKSTILVTPKLVNHLIRCTRAHAHMHVWVNVIHDLCRN